MSKLDYEFLTLEKLNRTVKEQLPEFAKSFFKAKRNQMAISSLYGYTIDISTFFRYIETTTSIGPKDFTLKDLNKISESDIENFIELKL